ncbi:MAG: hypothetical protein M1829_003865 [Trizodia sp. TS-e1964]|nr:MAG: hypothetical protein M1829_003865 [Trizodia sp. TS-e1964]
MLLPTFPTILLSVYMLAGISTALPTPTTSLLSSPSSSTTQLTPRSPRESAASAGLSADFISDMPASQFKRLKGDIYNAYRASAEVEERGGAATLLNQKPLLLELQAILETIDKAEVAPDQYGFTLARLLRGFGEDIAQLKGGRGNVEAMSEFFENLSEDNYA